MVRVDWSDYVGLSDRGGGRGCGGSVVGLKVGEWGRGEWGVVSVEVPNEGYLVVSGAGREA